MTIKTHFIPVFSSNIIAKLDFVLGNIWICVSVVSHIFKIILKNLVSVQNIRVWKGYWKKEL